MTNTNTAPSIDKAEALKNIDNYIITTMIAELESGTHMWYEDIWVDVFYASGYVKNEMAARKVVEAIGVWDVLDYVSYNASDGPDEDVPYWDAAKLLDMYVYYRAGEFLRNTPVFAAHEESEKCTEDVTKSMIAAFKAQLDLDGEPDDGDSTIKGFSNAQIEYALSEAPNYTDVDAFVSDMLTSSMFLDPEDEEAEIPTELSELLYKLWHVAALPFKEFLACMDLTQTECSRRYCIPLRTVQGWAGGSRTPPMYVRYMIAQLELYLDL